MASRIGYLTPLCLAALVAGCFDDAQLHIFDGGDAASSDLGPVDVPMMPPDAGADVVTPPDAMNGDVTMPPDGDLDVPTVDVAKDVSRPDVAPGECPIDRVLVTTSDYRNGGYALGRFSPTPSLAARAEMALDQDHIPVVSNCVVYDMLRSSDELAVFDPASYPTPARRIPLRPASSTGTMTYQVNPYDVLGITTTKAYVVQYAVPQVAVIDPTMSGRDAVRSTIDLAPVRASMDMDSSGSPEAAAIVRAGRYAFIALQNLNMYAPVTNGTLAVIDTASDMLVDASAATSGLDPVRLSGRNPVAMAVTPGGRLVVAEAGVLAFMPPQMLDGGIEVVDPVLLTARGLRITETQLGGDLSGFVMFDDARGWALVTQLDMSGTRSSRVVEFDLDAADGMRVGRTILMGGDFAAIARDPTNNVWVLDRTMGRAGARVINPAGMEITTMPLSTGALAPVGIAFVP